jgi:hypothetical protein
MEMREAVDSGACLFKLLELISPWRMVGPSYTASNVVKSVPGGPKAHQTKEIYCYGKLPIPLIVEPSRTLHVRKAA